MSEYVTGFQTKDGIKKYDYNSLANLPDIKDVTDTVISPNADYAEVGEWADGNLERENRLGYFVAIAEVGDNTIKIRKAKATDDVRGVSVYNPAFSGNASKNKYGEDGELLPQYNYIGVMGIVKIIDKGLCTVGGRCMPADDGTATPSSNNMGYAVLERVDQTHVLIAVEPGADMVQRVKADVKSIEDQLAGGGLTEEQKALLNRIAQEYADRDYIKMTVSFIQNTAAITCEMGHTADITFWWQFTHEVSEVTFNGETQDPTKEGYKTIEGITSTSSYTVKGTRKDGKQETAQSTAKVTFLNKCYYGCAEIPAEVNSNFIKGLKNKEFTDSLKKSFSGYCASGQYIWYAYPVRFGKAKFYMAPKGTSTYFLCDAEPSTVPVTNSSGFTEPYYVYRNEYTGQSQEVKFEKR